MPDIIRGVIPVAPTVFSDSEDLDLHGQKRTTEFLVAAKSAAICVLANYSEQFSLDDSERKAVIETTIAAAGDTPVCVTASHYSARVANQRVLQAEKLGAKLVMLMPPFFGATIKVAESDLLEYFKRVTDDVNIDVMIQDAPMSPTAISVDTFAQLAREIPQIRYAKIEVAQSANKIQSLAEVAGNDLPGVYDGEEAITLFPDLDAGAQGTMCSASVPEILADVVAKFHSGDRNAALAQWENILPLIHFENRQCGLRAAKILLQQGGIIASAKTRSPFGELHPDTISRFLEIAKRKNPLILNWAK